MNSELAEIVFPKVLEQDLPGDFAALTEADISSIMTQAKAVLNNMVEFRELMMMYSCAMKEIRTKFDVLNTEFNVRYQRNPISSINTRLKSTGSIIDKLARKNLDVTVDNIENYINDVAGIRVICTYIDDIYRLADALTAQDDIILINKKDYISEPKANGYRSLHLIVNVPVFFSEQKKMLKVEVQIRTIAMDFWASLEHQMKYKKEINAQEEIVARLKKCADTISDTDIEMMNIRRHIEESAAAPSEDEMLFDKIMRLQNPFT